MFTAAYNYLAIIKIGNLKKMNIFSNRINSEINIAIVIFYSICSVIDIQQ